MDQLKLLLSLLVILKAERGLEFIPLSCICSYEHFPSSRHSRSHVSFQRGSDPFYFFVFLTTITKRRGILNSFSDGSSPHPLQVFSASFGETFPVRFSSEIFCRDLTSDSKSESKEDSSFSELIQSVRRSSRIEFSGRIWPTNINWKKNPKITTWNFRWNFVLQASRIFVLFRIFAGDPILPKQIHRKFRELLDSF